MLGQISLGHLAGHSKTFFIW